MINEVGTIKKGWGHEEIVISTPFYCLKFLFFSKKGNKFSMHYHKNKAESWFVQTGSFILEEINLEDATISQNLLAQGDRWNIGPFTPHRLTALEDNSIILEVSTADHKEDNFKLMPGDSQNATDEGTDSTAQV